MFDSMLGDVRFTARLLAARPGWTAAAILCLAIATGANTAAFTFVNGLLLRPLPFEQPEQLVMVALRERSDAGPRPFALQEYRALSNESADVGMLLARTFFPLSLSADDGAQMAQAEMVSGNYFETLRVKPFAGRFFDSTADRAGGELQAVLSHALWRRRFGADLAVVGRSMRVNGRPMQSTQPRYDTTGVVATTLDVNQLGLARAPGISLYQQVVERLSVLPGVASVALTRDLPLGSGRTVRVASNDTATPGEPVVAAAMVVSPDYFQTVGVSIRQGRSFSSADPARPRVAVVNESMAGRLWPGGSPLGRLFGAQDGEPIEVIGVVPDVEEGSLEQRPQRRSIRHSRTSTAPA